MASTNRRGRSFSATGPRHRSLNLQGLRREQPLAVVGDDLDLARLAGIDGERLLHDHVVADQGGPAGPAAVVVAPWVRAVDAPDHLGADAAAAASIEPRGELDVSPRLLGAAGQQLDLRRGPESRIVSRLSLRDGVLVLALRIALEQLLDQVGAMQVVVELHHRVGLQPAHDARASSVPLREAAKKPAGVIASHWPSRPPMRTASCAPVAASQILVVVS